MSNKKLPLKYILIFSTFVSVSKTLHKSLSIERVETQGAGLFAFNDLPLSTGSPSQAASPTQGRRDVSPLATAPVKMLTISKLLNDGGVSNLTAPSAKTKNYTETSGDASQWSGYEFIPLGVGVNLFSDLLSYRFLGSAISLNTLIL